MDEKPAQLLTEARDGFTSNSTGVRYEDNEYARNPQHLQYLPFH